MENENKTVTAEKSTDKSHKNHHRNKHHKPKPYYTSDKKNADASQKKVEAAPVQVSTKQEQQQQAQQSVNTNNNHSNKNKKKHKKPNRQPEQRAEKSQESIEVATSKNAPSEILEFSKADKLESPATKKLGKFSASAEYEKYSDYDEYSYEDVYGIKSKNVTEAPTDAMQTSSENSDEVAENSDDTMVEVVGIKFKSSGKTYYFEPGDIKAHVGSHAIVKTARGLEYGEVALANTFVKESDTVPPLRPIVRIATEADIKHHAENKEKEDQAFRICNEKIIEHELDMKLIDAQYTFDNSKLLFYFTSSGRVDFRELVKDLAAVFRTRIELRQIGIRDEAKMVGGLGLCGRPLCCSIFLTDFGQVSIKMAKEQNLSLNSSKISGICGRLMCCLRYEYEAYDYEIKRTPPVESLVRTVDGVGTVTEISPLSGTIKVKLSAQPDVPPKTYKREDVTILKKKNENQ